MSNQIHRLNRVSQTPQMRWNKVISVNNVSDDLEQHCLENHIEMEASVYLTAVLEYLVAAVFDKATTDKCKRIEPRHLDVINTVYIVTA